MMRNAEKTVGNLIDRCKTSFISYIDDGGYPVTKAMLSPREREGIREFWFSTNTSSNKVRFLKENPKAGVYFMDRRFFRGVSLTGTVEVLEAPEARARIWRPGDHHILSGGSERPGLLCPEVYGGERTLLQQFQVGGFCGAAGGGIRRGPRVTGSAARISDIKNER